MGNRNVNCSDVGLRTLRKNHEKYSQFYLCLNIIIIITTIVVGRFLIQKLIITTDRKLLAIILICIFG